MSFRILRAAGMDAQQWLQAWSRLPVRLQDLHYLPEYGAIYRETYGQEPLLAVYEDADRIVLSAVVRRPLAALPFLAAAGVHDAYTEIATPYGFAGPLVAGAEGNDACACLQAFDRGYRDWCRQERIASEFICLHPLLDNHAPVLESGIAAPAPTKEVVVLDLAQSEERLWGAVSRGTRSSIQRARREGVRIEQVAPDAAALATLRRLYEATMRRRGAAARWYFPEVYVEACVRQLGPQRSALFFARYHGEVAAAYLLLNDAQSAYYHLGASDERWLALRPNNLLMYETALWARARGLKRYHLGGGVTPNGNDSLLRFKSSFGGARAVLYTYGRVLNEAVYRQLCELKLDHEQRTAAAIADADYFPFYRR